MKKDIGLVGFGSFGQFITPYLSPHFNIFAYNRSDRSEEANALGVTYTSLKDVASKKIVILCVPVQFLEHSLNQIKDFVQPDALIIDVSSVKVKPVALMEKILPSNIQIVATHPLFGPQSGKNGIKDMNFVLCPTKDSKLTNSIRKFLINELQLNVLERSPELHDKQMAYVQALTHFVGRAINEMDVPDVEQKTQAYQYLLNIKKNLGRDSMDLFLTIENENPFAKEVRENFLKELHTLHNHLEDQH